MTNGLSLDRDRRLLFRTGTVFDPTARRWTATKEPAGEPVGLRDAVRWLQTDSGSAALTAFVQSYQKSDYGLVPWRERAEVLRKGMLARVPPMAWSPEDGRPPK